MTMLSDFTTRPVISGTFGVVASTHWLASQTGMNILEKGGNAFDAAVAAGLALQVVEPHMNGIGGDAVAIIQRAGEAMPTVICGQGVAPARATIAHYHDQGLTLVPGTGLLAAVVPGAFDAWMIMLRDHGTMTLAEAMLPAIRFARDGYALVAGVTNSITGVRQLFESEWTTSAAIYLPGGDVPQPGSLFRNPKLADTYTRILSEAARAGADREKQIEAARTAFYKGFVAEAIEAFAATTEAMDASGARHKGVLAASDLAAWQATYEKPVTYDYRGYTVCKPGPWSQAPVLLQVLALLKGFDIAAMDTVGADFVHTLVEAKKLAYLDRDAYYGDPNFVDVPLATLLSDAYNDERRKLIGDTASLEFRPGRPDGREPRLPNVEAAAVAAAGVGEPTRVEREMVESYDRSGGAVGLAASRAARGPAEGDTCHLDVIDRFGNMVAATPSGGWLQSSPIIPSLGFCLGTRAQMFWLDPDVPSALNPGRRPRTTLTPSLALKDGKPYLAFGSPGGDNQDQWIVQFFLRHVEHKLNLQAAIDAPQLQCDHWQNSFYPRTASPGKIILEGRFPNATVDELRRRGHDVQITGDWALGRNCAAAKDGEVLRAAATPRLQQAYAVGR
ncbi:MAG TPA: gamma-glutamyltransferase family protein [Alphaproteobacteria bacterium]|nr:gamma-glutamyltransferase family protein [Alphaproteobacteria bacterium]